MKQLCDWQDYLKVSLGVLLLICAFLPLGSCQRRNPVPERATAVTENTRHQSESPDVAYLIPVTYAEIRAPATWILLLSLVWPLPVFLFSRWRFKSVLQKRIASGLECLLAIFSAYIIYSYVFTLWYEPLIWGYLAVILMAGYGMLNFHEIICQQSGTRENPRANTS